MFYLKEFKRSFLLTQIILLQKVNRLTTILTTLHVSSYF